MSAKPCEIFQGVSGPFCAHDVQDMRLPELSKTHSSLTGVGRERRGDGNGLYSPGAGCPLSPPGIRTEVGFSPLPAHLRQWFDVVQRNTRIPLGMWESKF